MSQKRKFAFALLNCYISYDLHLYFNHLIFIYCNYNYHLFDHTRFLRSASTTIANADCQSVAAKLLKKYNTLFYKTGYKN